MQGVRSSSLLGSIPEIAVTDWISQPTAQGASPLVAPYWCKSGCKTGVVRRSWCVFAPLRRDGGALTRNGWFPDSAQLLQGCAALFSSAHRLARRQPSDVHASAASVHAADQSTAGGSSGTAYSPWLLGV